MKQFPFTDHFQELPCGTRAKYVQALCRCDRCRAANSQYVRARNRLASEAAREVVADAGPAPQRWTAPDGTMRVRLYKRACPGVNGQPCRHRRHLRKDSKGGVCGDCRMALIWNGIVPAAAARAHLLKLSRAGVGRHAVHDACDVSVTTIMKIRSGEKTHVRAQTARRILAVTVDARAGNALVSARRTWKQIERLLREGFTKAELARRLGFQREALQFNKVRITARTAMRVDRFYHVIMVAG